MQLTVFVFSSYFKILERNTNALLEINYIFIMGKYLYALMSCFESGIIQRVLIKIGSSSAFLFLFCQDTTGQEDCIFLVHWSAEDFSTVCLDTLWFSFSSSYFIICHVMNYKIPSYWNTVLAETVKKNKLPFEGSMRFSISCNLEIYAGNICK